MIKQMSLILFLSAAVYAAESGVQEFEGKVISVDVPHHQLSVKDTKEHTLSIRVEAATAINSATNEKLALKDLKANDKVHIYYTTTNMTARQIDRTGTFGLMGEIGVR